MTGKVASSWCTYLDSLGCTTTKRIVCVYCSNAKEPGNDTGSVKLQ